MGRVYILPCWKGASLMLVCERIKHLIKKMLFSYRCDSDAFVAYLRQAGAEVGERIQIFDPRHTIIDVTRPYLLKIGDDVQITSGVTILTHGYDWSVFKGLYGEVLGSAGEVTIGNNCFIGMHTTILKGVHIGNNCIIGANSLVNKDIPDGWVAAGNPAVPIMKIEDYHKKRVALQLQEAKELYRCYVKRMRREPPIEEFDEFFWLFQRRDKSALTAGEYSKLGLVGSYDRSLAAFLKSKPLFNGYEDFLRWMRENNSTHDECLAVGKSKGE